jgi:poly(A) polymerase
MFTLTDEQRAQVLTPDVQRLMTVLEKAGAEARVVGGAVRDALLGREVGDIDLATTLPPENVQEVLARAHIKSVPTGLAHGTITAVVNRKGYEITTLRKDVETDGRHARVVFTNDWQADAARRDFTLNALYTDASGVVYDYFDGAEDARRGCVRFIGNARARISEDVLRVLRFFRFYAYYGRGEADKDSYDACCELAPLLPKLSVERIAREFLKLLAASDPLPALRLMQKCGVLSHFLHEASSLDRLENLFHAEQKFGLVSAPLARMAALLPENESIARPIPQRLKFSKADAEALLVLVTLPKRLRDDFSVNAVHRMMYAYGADFCRNALLLNGGDISDVLAETATWTIPTFPIKGEDLLKLGILPGPGLGEILREVQDWWIDGDFRADRTACLAKAKQWEHSLT